MTLLFLHINKCCYFRGGTLKISPARRDDRGIYKCLAENGVGPAAETSVTVKIEFAPVSMTLKPRIGQAFGYEVTIECLVEAYPIADVSWWRNGKRLSSVSEKIDSNKDEIISVYSIYEFNSYDVGEYTCKAVNKYGKSESLVELFGKYLYFHVLNDWEAVKNINICKYFCFDKRVFSVKRGGRPSITNLLRNF